MCAAAASGRFLATARPTAAAQPLPRVPLLYAAGPFLPYLANPQLQNAICVLVCPRALYCTGVHSVFTSSPAGDLRLGAGRVESRLRALSVVWLCVPASARWFAPQPRASIYTALTCLLYLWLPGRWQSDIMFRTACAARPECVMHVPRPRCSRPLAAAMHARSPAPSFDEASWKMASYLALATAVFAQVPSTAWAFPGQGDCDQGCYLVRKSPVQGTQVVAIIREKCTYSNWEFLLVDHAAIERKNHSPGYGCIGGLGVKCSAGCLENGGIPRREFEPQNTTFPPGDPRRN